MARARSRLPKTHVCDICHKTFSRSDVVIRHKANIHSAYKQDRSHRGGNTRRPCSNCSSSKLRCWGEAPCENCRQRGLTCDLKPKNVTATPVMKADMKNNLELKTGSIEQIAQISGGYGQNLTNSMLNRQGERPFSASSGSSYNSSAILTLDPYHYQFQYSQTGPSSSMGDITTAPASTDPLSNIGSRGDGLELEHQYYPIFFEPLYNNIYLSGNPTADDRLQEQNMHYDRNENEEPAIPNMWHSGNDWLKVINNNFTNNNNPDPNEMERPVYTYLS